MRKRVAIAVVMLVASMFVSAAATAADVPFSGEIRGDIVGWGYTYQEAQANAYKLADAEGKPYKVMEFRQGKDPFHTPPCWWRLLINWEVSDDSPFDF